MITTEKRIDIFVAKNGRSPFKDWLNALKDRTTINKIEARLARVRAGNLGDYKYVGGGVFELKVDYGPGYRIYFAEVGSKIILILCGGDKKTQTKDIKKAQNYWAETKKYYEAYPL